jgi:AcrR family transcriptional regulator
VPAAKREPKLTTRGSGAVVLAESRRRGADSAATSQRLVDAAFETVRTQGFRGATARNIAAVAECNQAAIYYHFGGIEPLLIESIRASSDRRLAAYREALDGVTAIGDILDALETLHHSDVASGHLDVLTELLGGITAEPSLGPGIRAAVMPWLEFVGASVQATTASLRYGSLVPAADIADAVFSFVIGTRIQAKFDGDTTRFTKALNMARLANALLGNLVAPTAP